ncbi:hypothetical protein HN681_00390 [archaeon]|jgi:hypothetical protein|nr:hypothetical protein [archaeon]MBT3730757.1 hypothetical protein [archaeon]MBT4669659.1 hypothetical protein [archaeon]MBT5030416.1 hypothetical protein [archaeon]MBT5288291.1 hypothetical protein [archaeon]
MNAIEIMALIVVVLGLVKMIVIFKNPKSWMGVVNFFFKKPKITMWVSAVLAVVTLWFLLQTFSIVQIFGVILFVMFLYLMTFAAYSKELMQMVTKMLKDKHMLRRAMLPIVIWTALMLWALYALFL